jgi:hypothetical protein
MDDANPSRRWPKSWQAPWQAPAPRVDAVPSIDADRPDGRDDPADMGTAFGLDLSLCPAADLPSDRHRAADEPPRD